MSILTRSVNRASILALLVLAAIVAIVLVLVLIVLPGDSEPERPAGGIPSSAQLYQVDVTTLS
jgi:hypothetical protein